LSLLCKLPVGGRSVNGLRIGIHQLSAEALDLSLLASTLAQQLLIGDLEFIGSRGHL